MSDPHVSASVPVEDEPQTPMWLPALGAALFIAVALWWAVTPAARPASEAPPAPASSSSSQAAPSPPSPPSTLAAAPAHPAAPPAPANPTDIQDRLKQLREHMGAQRNGH